MTKIKKALILALILVGFFLLSFFEFKLSREDLLTQINQPSASISISSFPSDNTSTPTFTWRIDGPPSTTNTTSIYYDYQSTPSAVTKADSPQALGYHYHTPDYFQGSFSIPQTFEASITPRTGPLFFRAYTYTNGEHLWTPEYKVIVK